MAAAAATILVHAPESPNAKRKPEYTYSLRLHIVIIAILLWKKVPEYFNTRSRIACASDL